MSKSANDDSEFQKFIKTFRDHFGIQQEKDVQTQEHKLIAKYVQIDALIVFPEDFDFTTLKDKIFPFLGLYEIFEYKGKDDPVLPAHFYQYSFTELGLITTRFLSKERTDRKAWNLLSNRGARERWQKIKAQGAKHSCCTVILSTTDPKQLKKEVGFQPVTDYEHLGKALHRVIISENRFVGSIATYLVVLNHLPVCAKNVPLLLLTTGKKKIEFCKWLISDHEGVTLEEKRFYQAYLLDHNLIQDKEAEKEMKYDLFGPADRSWIFEEITSRSEEEQEEFRQLFYSKMLNAHSPVEVAQKALGASSPVEVALKALGASSPVEVALKAIQTEEQRRTLLAYLQQMSLTTTGASAASAAQASA